MAFNFKAFATGFMNDQARQINERVAEARDYKRELKENAEASKSKIGKLKQLAGFAKSEISRLRGYGVDDKFINAASASGPKGLFDLSTAVQEEAARRNFKPGQKFDEFEVEALLEIPKDFKYADVDAMKFYEMNTALTKPSLGSTKDTKRGVFGTLLGLDLDDAVRSRLDEDAYFDGYSVMDINEISKQEAYESVAPGTYFSFAPTKAVDISNATRSLQTEINRIRLNIEDNKSYYMEKARKAFDKSDGSKSVDLLLEDEKRKALQEQTLTFVTALAADNPIYIEKMAPILEQTAGISEGQIEALRFDAMAERELEVNIANLMLEKAPVETRDIGQRMRFSSAGQDYEVVVSEGDVVSLKLNGNPMDPKLIPGQLELIIDEGGLSSIKKAEIVRDVEAASGGRSFDPKEQELIAPEAATADQIDEVVDDEEEDTEEDTVKKKKRQRPIDKVRDFFSELPAVKAHSRSKEDDTEETDETTEEIEYTKDNPINLKDMTEEEARDAFANLKSGDYFINPSDNRVAPKP